MVVPRYAVAMNISEQMLNKFILIYKDEFGEEINHKEASEVASRLLMLYERLAIAPAARSDGHATQLDDDRHRVGFRT